MWDEEGGFWYIPKSEAADEETTTRRSGPLRAPAASGTGTTIAFPDFDKNKIDVAGFPDYVKKLIASPSSFTFLIVTSSKFYIWVSDCCVPAIADSSANLFIIDLSRTSSGLGKDATIYSSFKSAFPVSPSYKACYSATYSWSSSSTTYSTIVNPWGVADSKTFVMYNADGNAVSASDGNTIYTYPIPYSLPKATTDFFVFGYLSNSPFSDSGQNYFDFPFKSGVFRSYMGSNSTVISAYNRAFPKYSEDGASKFRFIDGGAFPTAESQQSETQRGILGQLKALPDKIKGFFTTLTSNIKAYFNSLGDRISGFFDNLFTKIKGLFIPSDGFFDTYFSDLKTFFAERFGFIYDLPAAVVTILNKLINYTPAESGYHIHFPEVSTPVISNGTLSWHKIIDEQDYYFDFLSNAPFSTLYSGYRAFVWLAYCFMLINLAKSKAANIFGGK